MEMLHSWELDTSAAIALQSKLRGRLALAWDGRPVRTVAGVDVSVRGELARAAIVVLDYPGLAPLEVATAELPVRFPYVPGLLSFREGPVVLAAWKKLAIRPDLALFDGQGIAHPRGIGLAAHLGLWLETPTIGVAKSRLFGRHAELGPEKGERTPLLDEEEPERVLGMVLRTRSQVRPVYVSPGHLMDVGNSAEWALACATRYRLPECTRLAHQAAGGARILPGRRC